MKLANTGSEVSQLEYEGQAALIATARNSNFIRNFTNTLNGREKERGIKIKMRVKLVRRRRIDHGLDINEEKSRIQS